MKPGPDAALTSRLSVGTRTLQIDPPGLFDARGHEIHLRPQALRVLQLLAMRVGEVVESEALFAQAWSDRIVTNDSLTQCVAEIRRALGDDRDHLVTVHRRGYRLALPNGYGSPAATAEPLSQDQGLEPTFQQTLHHVRSADGVRIAYAVAGTGPTVVQTPNWGSNVRVDWANSLYGPRTRELARHFRLIRMDNRGVASSDRSVDPGDVNDWVADLSAVIEATVQTRFAVFGVSGGGLTAIRYAARHPERVTCLVLLAAFSHGSLHGRQSRENLDAFLRLIEDGWGQQNDAFRQMITGQLFPGATQDMLRTFNEVQRMSCSGATAARLMAAISAADVDNDLPHICVPTLVIHGIHDVRNPIADAIAMAQAIPGARLETFGGENHMPLFGSDEFSRVMNLIRAFVLEHGSGDIEA